MYRIQVNEAWNSILFTRKFSSPCYFYLFPLRLGGVFKTGLIKYKRWCKKMREWANTRLGKSVSDLLRAKIRLGEFKLNTVSSHLKFHSTMDTFTLILHIMYMTCILWLLPVLCLHSFGFPWLYHSIPAYLRTSEVLHCPPSPFWWR